MEHTHQSVYVPDARVHYVVLKQQPHQPTPQPATTHTRRPQHKDRRNRLQEQKKHQKCPPALLQKGPVASGPNSAPNTTPTSNTPDTFPTTHTPTQSRSTNRRTSTRTQPRKPCQKNDSLIFHP